MPLISIIIPCYNAEKWILRCINSILNQNFDDLEIILIDDGSKDKTSLILTQLRDNKKIKIITKPNGGVSSARNAGIKAASGDWLMFVDVDDRLLSGSLSSIKQFLKSGSFDTDVIFLGYNRIGDKTNSLNPELLNKTVDPIFLAKELFYPSNFPYQGFPWAKLFKREIIKSNNILFDTDIFFNEDRLFILTYLAFVKVGIYSTQPVYEYNIHNNNTMASIRGPKYWRFETDLDAFVKMNDIVLLFNNTELTTMVKRKTIESYHWNKSLIVEFGNNVKENKRRIFRKTIEAVSLGYFIKQGIKSKLTSIKNRILSRG